jgi:membrane associated rhomboid family serine protease
MVCRPAYHNGASGLVFCFFGYLASQAYFRRTFGALILSVVCLVLYGGLLKGLLPTSAPVSWEGHLAGLAAGLLAAWTYGNPAQRAEIGQSEASEITRDLRW